jgi:hypothetical protein
VGLFVLMGLLELLSNQAQPSVAFDYAARHERIADKKDNRIRNILRLSNPPYRRGAGTSQCTV